MKMPRSQFSQRALAAPALAILGGLALSTGTLAQDLDASLDTSVAEGELPTIKQDIVVVGAPAARIRHEVRPIVTLMAPAIRPETAEERLDRVAYYLRASSAGRCANPEMLTGFALHETGAYDADQRDLVERHYRFGRSIGVRHIVTQSAAARSGFLAGDVITHVNGIDMASFETGLIGRRANYNRTERFETFLNNTLKSGPAKITIRRGQTVSNLVLPGQPGCGGKPVLYEKGGFNAWSDGKYVALTSTMMRFARDDGELAFVVSHEMAHNILDHAAKLRGKSMLLASLGIGSGKIKDSEIAADQLGAEILVTTGYPLEGALSLLNRAGAKIPLNFATTHPGIKRRLGIVTEAAARFEREALAARAEREQPVPVAGLRDLAFMARSVVVPNVALSMAPLPALADFPAGQLAEAGDPSNVLKSAVKAQVATLTRQGGNGLASISFTATQEDALASTFGAVRAATA